MSNCRSLFLTATIAAALVLAGCASTSSELNKPKPAPQMYKHALSAINASYWSRAVSRLQNLEATYPFGKYAVQAELDLIYVYYMVGDHDSATDEANRFIREHPRNQYVPYALYMKGIVNFPEGMSMFKSLFSVPPAGFDHDGVLKSFQAFHDLVLRYPKSPYSPDARQRMIYLRNRLAAYDCHVAEYYTRRGAWVAAIKRAQHVLKHYPQTPYVPKALKIMIQGYKKLNLDKLASDTQRILKANKGRYAAAD